jgi:hypothetical protein
LVRQVFAIAAAETENFSVAGLASNDQKSNYTGHPNPTEKVKKHDNSNGTRLKVFVAWNIHGGTRYRWLSSID